LVVAALLLVCATVTTHTLRSNAARAALNLRAHDAASASTVKTYGSQGRVVRSSTVIPRTDFVEGSKAFETVQRGASCRSFT